MPGQPLKLDPSSSELKRHGADLKKLAAALATATKALSTEVTKKSVSGLKAAVDDVADTVQGIQKDMTDLDKSLQGFEKAFGAQQKEEKEVVEKLQELESIKDINQVLKSDFAEEFRDYCKKEYALENLEFLEALQKRATPLSIYKQFIPPDAPSMINISGPEQKELVAKYGPIVEGNPSRNRPDLADFRDAKATIEKAVYRDTWNRFKNVKIKELEKQQPQRSRR